MEKYFLSKLTLTNKPRKDIKKLYRKHLNQGKNKRFLKRVLNPQLEEDAPPDNQLIDRLNNDVKGKRQIVEFKRNPCIKNTNQH